MSYAPCRNPNCSSFGRSHPNCHCWDHVSSESLDAAGFQRPGIKMAEGGEVPSSCSGTHKDKCKYFLADGGEAPTPMHPGDAVDLSIANQGLFHTLKSTGKVALANFDDSHNEALTRAKEHYSLNPNRHIYSQATFNTPLSGKMPKEKLDKILGHLSPRFMGAEPHPESARSSINHMHSALTGEERLTNSAKAVFGFEKESKIRHDATKDLDAHLAEIKVNPNLAIETGGTLGHYMPDHTSQLAATMAQASNYLDSIKPKSTSTGPLDEPVPPSAQQQVEYEQQLQLVNQPLSVLGKVKDGMLTKKDMTTLTTVYPKLYQKMTEAMSEQIIEAKSKNKSIPYVTKMALSLFLGQPMEASLAPNNVLAVMQANAPAHGQTPQSKPRKSSQAQIKQQTDNAEMYATKAQASEAPEKS